MKRYLILISLLCMSVLSLLAQPAGQRITIRGKVTSATDGEPLPSAYIFEVDKQGRIVSTAASDYDGNYSMLISSTDNIISCKYIGFVTKEIPVGTKTVINIALEEQSTALGDVEVTAARLVQTGMLQISERDVTTAVSRLDASEIEELSAASIDDAIQGRMAGVDIVATSGDPGAGMSIRIRGTTSINSSNEPLIVVDGTVYETTIGDFDFANANEEEYSQLLNVATEDIQEITVLKDAAATAIWGSRAANGVLQITTKRGSIGKPQVNYTFKGTLSHQPDAIPTLSGDQYTTMILESLHNNGTLMDMTANPEFAYNVNNPYYYYNYSQNTDWIGAVTQLGHTMDHSLSISGGTSKVRYRFSTNYWDQVGTTIGTDYSRITARMNLDYKVSEKLSFAADISYVHGDKGQNYLSSVRSKSYTKMPNQSIYEYNEKGQLSDVFFTPQTNQQGSYGTNGSNYNPLAMAYDGLNKNLSERITPKLNLTYRLLENLSYQADIAFDLNNSKTSKFLPQTATGLDWTNVRTNLATDADSESYSVQMYHKLYFRPDLGPDHTLDVLAGTITQTSSSESYSVSGSNTASSFLQDPSAGSRVTSSAGDVSSGLSRSRNMAIYAQAQYKYLDKYMINFTIRRDGDSKFGPNYRYGTFPSVSLRWRVSDEPFMQWAEKMDDLSFRASYGLNGNTPRSNYLSYSNYTTYNYSYLGTMGTYVKNLQLSNLRWEKVTQADLGVNLILFKNRINVDFDYYLKSSNDLLMNNLTIPSSSGFSNANYMNIGRMDNNGWELSVMTTPYKSKDLTINFNFNVSRSQNFIREISEYYSMEGGTWNTNGSYLTRYEIDQPIGSFYGYKYEGVYLNEDETIARDKYGKKIYTYDENNQRVPLYMKFGAGTSVDYQFEAGDAKYADINHDGNINQQDIVYLGNANPLFFGGFGPSVKYKQWSLSTHFNFRFGNDIVNKARMDMEKMYNYDNQSVSVLRRWRHSYENAAQAPEDLLPRALMSTGYNWLASDRFVEDGSFCRFRSLTLRYNFARELIKPLGLSNLSAYVTMQNIFVWTKYTGQDPEVTISPLSLGYDNALAPRTKDYVLGLSVTF